MKNCCDVVDLMVAEEGSTDGKNISFHSGLCVREIVNGDELIIFTSDL